MRKTAEGESGRKAIEGCAKNEKEDAIILQLLAAAGRSRPSTPTIPKILSDQEKLDIKLLKEEQKKRKGFARTA